MTEILPIHNGNILPVCSKCEEIMLTVNVDYRNQAATVKCENPECEVCGEHYRIVIPTFQGDRVNGS